MQTDQVESIPPDRTFDPEAVVMNTKALSSAEAQLPSASDTTHSRMETFEIEMGHGALDTTTNYANHEDDHKEHRIAGSTDTLEIPSILTAPSMDESIDDDLIVEMESLLRSSNSNNNSKDQAETTSMTEASETLDTTTTIKGGTNSQSPGKHQFFLQKCCSYRHHNYYCCCLPCINNTSSATTSSSSSSNHISTKPYRMGNIQVVYPPIYVRTNGWFVFGPHWFGPPFILLLVLVSSYYIIYVRCYQRHWYGTTLICSLLGASTIYHLLNTAYRDPGVIIKNSLPINHNDPASVPRSYRYCETCQYYQPSHAAHCPDCNVCVAGFDHHCVWMSICIGVGNYKVSDCLIQ